MQRLVIMVISDNERIIYIIINGEPVLMSVPIKHPIKRQTFHCSPIGFPCPFIGGCIIELTQCLIHILTRIHKAAKLFLTPLGQVIVHIGDMLD